MSVALFQVSNDIKKEIWILAIIPLRYLESIGSMIFF